MIDKIWRATFAVLVLVILGNAIDLRAESFTLKIVPRELTIGASFAGKDVRLSGVIPEDRDIIVEIKGPQKKAIFNMKGKIGPFWMNRAKIKLENAPYYYMLLLPEKLNCSDICNSFGIGIENLKKEISINVNNIDPEMIFTNFIELKRSENLYGERSDAIKYLTTKDGKKYFETKINFPSATAPGKYKIMVIQVQNNHVVDRYIEEYMVKEGGIIELVRRLAYEHELIYGIFCVIIAILFGLLIGLFFKRAGAH
jgi:hypothetical protein